MRIQTTLKLLSAALLFAWATAFSPVVSAAEEANDIHVQGENRGFPWTTADGDKKNWDIHADGKVASGTNSYSANQGGMILTVNGGGFAANGIARVSKDGREIEIGPWNWNGINVSRRIFVDPVKGYCRWIDIFENASGQDQTLNLRYVSFLASPVKELLSSSGAKQVDTKKDFAYATVPTDAAKAVMVHVFASAGSKVVPTIQANVGSADVYYNYAVAVPNGKAVAVCMFESQQPDAAKAAAFMKDFSPQIELAKVSSALRKAVANIMAPRFLLENIELPRSDKFDMVVQADGNEMMGTIANEKFVVDSLLGKLELPAAKVLGLNVPANDDPYVQIVLIDGQVIGGKLGAPLTLKLESGSTQTFQPEKPNFRSASFRISKERPQEFNPSAALLVLRSGQRLAFDPAAAACTLRSVYGEIKLDPAQVASISTDTSDGALHRVTFRNGTVLSGLISPDKLACKLDLGQPLEVSIARVSRMEVGPVTPATDLCRASLRNEDEVFGKLLDPTIELQTENGKIELKPADIATMDFQDEAFSRVELKLRNGRTHVGKVLNRTLKFKIEPGPEISVPTGTLMGISFTGEEVAPKKDPAVTTPPQPQPAVPGVPGGVIRVRPIMRKAVIAPAVMPAVREVQVKEKAAK